MSAVTWSEKQRALIMRPFAFVHMAVTVVNTVPKNAQTSSPIRRAAQAPRMSHMPGLVIRRYFSISSGERSFFIAFFEKIESFMAGSFSLSLLPIIIICYIVIRSSKIEKWNEVISGQLAEKNGVAAAQNDR